jgi:CDP-diacylglycerol--serine O-phosphatidyltransferase
MISYFKMKYIPNFITSLNLASGFIAIIFVGNGDILTASWLILAAMIFDFLDGLSARLLKAYSDIGKELDSLADVVSFGVAPALIIYHLLNDSLALSAPMIINSNDLVASIMLITPVIMPVCGALRLAIFNIDTTQSTTFRGLPIPANALAVISVVIASQYSHSPVFSTFLGSPAIMITYTIALSLLMVTRLPLLSLKVSSLKVKGNEGRYILAGMVLISFLIIGVNAIPLIIPLYIIASLVSKLF